MPGATSEPSVALSFANNFWGKDDAGVGPLLGRMHDAKTTCDEMKAFYTSRAAIEDEYARKLLALSKKPLGSSESGSLKSSLDTTRAELETMAKAHGRIASQMKTELEEPLGDFSGAMRERRKIVQNGCEKLLKLKTEQTQRVNKTRDRYEQDCLKIKGYLAQAHMVMGQEEKKNKTRLEKAQMALNGSNGEYENAIKALEDTTQRWNRDWKAACDKFQDLEEERIDFLKSSLWEFANISSTVCLTDDEACEKIRVCLEECEVEKDITSFIMDRGTGQEIPDPPKYINFCRGDISDDGASEVAEDYTIAQFSRNTNPSFRTASPNPSNASTHTSEPESELKQHHRSKSSPDVRQDAKKDRNRRRHTERPEEGRGLDDSRWAVEHQGKKDPNGTARSRRRTEGQNPSNQQPATRSPRIAQGQDARGPHNEYPLDGMTMYCRPGNLVSEGSSTAGSPGVRPSSSSASGSDYSNPTSVSSSEASQAQTPKEEGRNGSKRKSGFFPFRRKSKSEKDFRQQQQMQQQQAQQQQAQHQQRQAAEQQFQQQQQKDQQFHQQQMQQQQMQQDQQRIRQATLERRRMRQMQGGSVDQGQMQQPPALTSRNTWSANNLQERQPSGNGLVMPGRTRAGQLMSENDRHESLEPIDPRAQLALNVGGNVFDVSMQDKSKTAPGTPTNGQPEEPPLDPMVAALAELNEVTKGGSAGRNSADRFFGLATPAPPSATPRPGSGSAQAAAQRGTPPPNYPPPRSALDAPPPAHTAAQMRQTTQNYVSQRESMLQNSPSMPAVMDHRVSARQRSRTMEYPRAQSRQSMQDLQQQQDPRSVSPAPNRSVSPRPQIYGEQNYRGGASPKPASPATYSRQPSPNPYMQSRPGTSNGLPGQYTAYSNPGSPAPASPGGELALRGTSPVPSMHSQGSYRGRERQQSYHPGTVALHQGPQMRQRSKSMANERAYSRDGRVIMQYSRAMYPYNAVIPEELSFTKGDILAVLKQQDDGWWEAEVVGVPGKPGLVPSNYLQDC